MTRRAWLLTLSVALLLRHGLNLPGEADAVERAVDCVLEEGYRTADIAEASARPIGTVEMGERITAAVRRADAGPPRKRIR